MSTITPPPTPEQLEAHRRAQYVSLTRNLSIALLVACPAIAALPPRKLDLYTFALGGVWVASASHLTHQHTGQGIWRNLANTVNVGGEQLPTEKAREVKRQLEKEIEIRRAREEGLRGLERENEESQEKGILERVWMGGEKEGWKEKRLREEQEALDEGRGYGSLIMEQIWEVWNWGKSGDEDDEGVKKE